MDKLFKYELQTESSTWLRNILNEGGPLSVLQWWHLGQTFLRVSFSASFKVGRPYRFRGGGNPTTLSFYK